MLLFACLQLCIESAILPLGCDLLYAKVPKTVLLYGPRGSGKTMLSRAIANEAGALFFDLSPANILGKFNETSSATKFMVESVFQVCILFDAFHLIDSYLSLSIFLLVTEFAPIVANINHSDCCTVQQLCRDLRRRGRAIVFRRWKGRQGVCSSIHSLRLLCYHIVWLGCILRLIAEEGQEGKEGQERCH